MPSLQEQLLKAGLVDKKSLQKVKKEKHIQAKSASKTAKTSSGKGSVGKHNPGTNAIQAKNAERDRKLNQERQQRVQQKAIVAQIKQLVTLNMLDRSAGEIDYQFVHNKKIKKLLVTAEQQTGLARGRLGIVYLHSKGVPGYALVPGAIADKIAERDASIVVRTNENAAQSTESNESDPYASFEVPDDLMW